MLKLSVGSILGIDILLIGSQSFPEPLLLQAPTAKAVGHISTAECQPVLACHSDMATLLPVSTIAPTTTPPAAKNPVPEADLPHTKKTASPHDITKQLPSTTAPARLNTSHGQSLGIFEATCYAQGTITATGTKPALGTIAVDRRVIPLGTKLTVEGYGSGVALDTGGAIKGRRIDVYKPSEADCQAWGRRPVQVWLG